MTKLLPEALRDDPALADAAQDALVSLWSELLGKDDTSADETKAVATAIAKAQVQALVTGDADRVARLGRALDLLGELVRVRHVWERRDTTRNVAIALVRALARIAVVA